ncbi:nuclear transport factor 2 family protein [Flagellimonas sp. 389]|uniref:nuclear transport factor 2 family protein n=1 Tax=Flagellimonas sp. 389 TaxID=2835862 RepID=UPI001BD5D44D|nr:nuclear transport factor 2 family protein [Flagellimonas sp. 389]MBS9464194.1 nuclear transport factor 2 family protein [Flagellimonas sp. 389]
MNRTNIVITGLFLSITAFTNAQIAQGSELYMTLEKKDSTLFDAAFNQCNPEIMKTLFTEDFEFYHDKGGLTESRAAFLNPMRENCAKLDRNEPQPAKRILVQESLEVYPLHKKGELYGAIQTGIHSFEYLNENKEYQKGEIAKFTHVWILENGNWKIKRELSYDHQSQQ